LGNRSRSLARFIGILVIAIALAFFSSSLWLPWFGDHLVRAEKPVKSEALVVLAGDFSGNRILKAGELVRQGYAPIAIVSGPNGLYGHAESELAIDLAVAHGYPAAYFAGIPNPGRSTRDEASYMFGALKQRGFHKFILLTSDTHTSRAGKIYRDLGRRELGDGFEMTVVAAPSAEFTPHQWWKEREGRKAVLLEWMKTFANWFRL
jgi:uncharacterized SAM-binding protein YcdF (DUF218 family)